MLSNALLAVRRRPRLPLCAVVAVVAYWLTPAEFQPATRALIAWNVGAWVFLALVAVMVSREAAQTIRQHAMQEDESPWILLIIGLIAACAALAAIVWELGPVKDMTGLLKASHIALVASTILSAFTFIHVLFGLHYAGQFYALEDGTPHGGLEFPGGGDPAWGDFFYHAFVIGCACATADVNTTSRAMRSACLVQGVVAFFFNTIILALTINIGAGLI